MAAKKKKMRIGVIGAGAIAQACHIPGYAAAKNCELVGVADPVKRCRDQVRDNGWEFEHEYSDYQKMLRECDLDAVSICTPNALHKEMALAAAKAGCDILLEKPVALTVADANAIKRAVAKYKVRLMAGFTHRFNALNEAARKALKAKKIGKPYMFRVRFAHTGPWPGWARTDWFYKPELAGGGAMLDMAIHAFDLLHWYHKPIRSVQAEVRTLRKKIKVDDNAVAVLDFGDNFLGYVEVGWTSPSGFVGVEIMGDKGSITVNYATNKTTMTSGSATPDGKMSLETTELCDASKHTPAWLAEMAYFTKLLGTRKKSAVGIDDGIASLKVALAAYKSSDTGKRVKVNH